MEEGQFTVSAPIEAKLEANVVTSITIKDISGKVDAIMSNSLGTKIMEVESKLIPMQISRDGNLQMIKVGVQLTGVNDIQNEIHEIPDPPNNPWDKCHPWDIPLGVRIKLDLRPLYTEPRKMVCTWLRDMYSWPCLAFLLGPA